MCNLLALFASTRCNQLLADHQQATWSVFFFLKKIVGLVGADMRKYSIPPAESPRHDARRHIPLMINNRVN
jgi:hypothetical protein